MQQKFSTKLTDQPTGNKESDWIAEKMCGVIWLRSPINTAAR